MLGLDNPLHIAFLLVLLLLVFGAKRLPEIGRSLGSGLRGFKDSLTGEDLPTTQPTEAAPALTEAPQPIAPHHLKHTSETVGAGGVRASA